MTTDTAATSHPVRLRAPAILIGVELGGFVDGIGLRLTRDPEPIDEVYTSSGTGIRQRHA